MVLLPLEQSKQKVIISWLYCCFCKN
jgi:hypothetical protein